jgi:hypothetical protein
LGVSPPYLGKGGRYLFHHSFAIYTTTVNPQRHLLLKHAFASDPEISRDNFAVSLKALP